MEETKLFEWADKLKALRERKEEKTVTSER